MMKLVKIICIYIFLFPNDIIGQDANNSIESNCSQVVSGFVKNRDTNDFIKGASVKLYQGDSFIKATNTNSKGEYSFNVNCESKYNIITGKTYYTTSKRGFSTSNVNNISVKFTFNLEAINSTCDQILRGRIIDDQTNEPIENVTVLINDANGNIIATDITNVNGNYHITLPCKKKYKLIASKENFVTQTKDIVGNKINNYSQRNDIPMKSNKCTRLIYGRIFNAETNSQIDVANITLLKNNTKLDSKDLSIDGKFQFDAKCDSNYTLKVVSAGFKDATITITSFNRNSVLPESNIALNPNKALTERDAIIVDESQPKINIESKAIIRPNLEPTSSKNSMVPIIETKKIEFDLNDSAVNRKIAIELNKIVSMMKISPEINVELKSHTDSRGPDQYNLDLTEARAQSMVSFIISKGIESDRISGKGFGETELLNECNNGTNCKESLHQQNKRVEYIIITNGIK